MYKACLDKIDKTTMINVCREHINIIDTECIDKDECRIAV